MPVPDCPTHGPGCSYSLALHPLPSQGREATSKGPYPDFDFDDVHGEMADLEAQRHYG